MKNKTVRISGRQHTAPKTEVATITPYQDLSDSEVIALARGKDSGTRQVVPNFTGTRPISSRVDALNLLAALADYDEHLKKEAEIHAKELAEQEAANG
jgi:hypothetical protein